MKSYDYAHRSGVRKLSWADFASHARTLAELLEPFHPQIILGVARAGLFPAVTVACSLCCELFPIRLTRRLNDQVITDHPIWKVPVPREVAGKVVAVIDDIADTGETLAMAAGMAESFGAIQLVTACLVTHSWANPAPQISSLMSDEFIIFPWDRQVLKGGKWVTHPEIASGIEAQSRGPKI